MLNTTEARFNMMKKTNFLEEAVMMVDFSHPNVLTLLAITIEDNIPNVILPFMENGDLRSYVLDEKNKFVLGELLNFCLQVASGMEYLALKKFVHRDLAARNCMVDSSLTVKVADFGLARDLYETNYYIAENRSIPLPYKWMPIECLSGKLQFSEKTDVWSYGVLMWEVFTRGGSPYFDLQHRELKHFLKRGERLEKPEIVPDYLYAVMCSCWHSESRSRPTFSELKSSIESIFTFDQDYLTHQKEAKEESQLVQISEHEKNNVYEFSMIESF
ncbi:hypothetical protein HELRODRAFT_192108 [Helobdella robusta]|uniref:Protein kinase domain-containing protein n=1 Tax=Helobdella robusta TaxID=6412 RepID=T1FTK8_HELRO|nr:hypothetical protein HELRODRAFT_192108 [Helobdella robusta]ESO03081.1 hypothetical protein HELRODRAFT_192108 [Helobdella robusta]